MPSPPLNSDYLFDRASSPSIVVSNQLSVDTADIGQKASQRSCTTCRRRKVRCNKESPCSNCVKNGVACIFPPPGRARPTPRGRRSDAGKSSLNHEQGAQHLTQALRARHNDPETVLGLAGSQGHTAGASSASVAFPRARPIRGFNEIVSSKEQWIERCLYFGERPPKPLYQIGSPSAASRDNGGDVYASCLATITRLFAESPGSVPADSEDEDMEIASENDENHSVDRLLQTTPTIIDHEAFILGPPDDSPSSPHPSPSEIPFYWQTFVENVDPLIKIFHVPSMNQLMREIQRNIGSLSPSEDALMFAIYLAAVTSMTPNEAQELLGQDKETLVAQYRLATKKSLARAEFMSSSDLMTLQAVVLFLFCLRESDQSRFTWTMTALVVRLAQGLGIHRVRRGTDLSPYNTEISLRLWLSIWLLDLRTALDQGTNFLITEDPPDSVLPLNINDSDLDPASVAYPPSKTGMTDMAPSLIKYEIGMLMKKLAQPDSKHALDQEDMQQMTAICRTKLEEEYMQNCVDEHSFHRFTALTTQLFFAEAPLLIYHHALSSDSIDLSAAAKDRLLNASIETIECSHELVTTWEWPRWARQPCSYVHWHAISIIIEELCVRSSGTESAQKAWNAIDLAIGCWGSPTQQQDELWKPLIRLAKKARKKRAAIESLHPDPTRTDGNLDDQLMSVDWTLANPEIPLWPTEISPGYLYDDMGEDLLLGSGGSPSDVISYMM